MFQCCKFKCYPVGEEEALLTYWLLGQDCLAKIVWFQLLRGTPPTFTSARRAWSLPTPTSSSGVVRWGNHWDFFFSPDLFPLFHCVSSRPLLDAEHTGLKGDTALLLLVSSCPDVTAIGFRTRAARRAPAAWEPLLPRASRCTMHLHLDGSQQFESMLPPHPPASQVAREE